MHVLMAPTEGRREHNPPREPPAAWAGASLWLKEPLGGLWSEREEESYPIAQQRQRVRPLFQFYNLPEKNMKP